MVFTKGNCGNPKTSVTLSWFLRVSVIGPGDHPMASGTEPASLVTERRYLTSVFVDLVGYTALSEKLDPEDLRLLQRRYQNLALTVMERFGGFVAQFQGDGVVVYFGY